jgi:hypothetical protein
MRVNRFLLFPSRFSVGAMTELRQNSDRVDSGQRKVVFVYKADLNRTTRRTSLSASFGVDVFYKHFDTSFMSLL